MKHPGVNTCDSCLASPPWLLCSPELGEQLCMACWLTQHRTACEECGTALGDSANRVDDTAAMRAEISGCAVLDLDSGMVLCWDADCGKEGAA